MMGETKIIINRASSMLGAGKKYKIELDGFAVAELANGGMAEIFVGSGNHTLSFVAFGKCERSVGLHIAEDTGTVYMNAKLNKTSGKIELECNDQSVFSGAAGTIAPKKKKKKTGIVIAAIIFGLIIIGALFGSPSGNGGSGDLTPEESAEKLLVSATKEFEASNYMKAISICDEIVEKYPDTACAQGVPSYLSEQYSKFTHISATTLMDEYEANIVNADKQYTNQVLVVNGTVIAIDKTNNGNNLGVMLKTNYLNAGVQLNFDTDQEDSVAGVSVGDSLTVIGKCTGRSGKQLLILNGLNVMVSDCFIINN